MKRNLKVPSAREEHPFTPSRVLPGLPDAQACPCRKLSEQLYSVAKNCPRHDDGCTSFGHCCDKPGLRCWACEENARRAA